MKELNKLIEDWCTQFTPPLRVTGEGFVRDAEDKFVCQVYPSAVAHLIAHALNNLSAPPQPVSAPVDDLSAPVQSSNLQPKEGIDKRTAKQVIESYVEGELDWGKPVESLPMTIEDMLYEYVAQFGIEVYDDGFGGETYKQPQSPTEPVSGERTGEEGENK